MEVNLEGMEIWLVEIGKVSTFDKTNNLPYNSFIINELHVELSGIEIINREEDLLILFKPFSETRGGEQREEQGF